MKTYTVNVSKETKQRLREILQYLRFRVKSEQAVQAVYDDYKKTRDKLQKLAGTMKLDDDPDVAARGYHRIHFDKHRYFLLYKIEGDTAEVAYIFHDLEDYVNKM